ILYVIWPALLLYHVAARAGLDRMGSVFANVLPREVENVLLVAWVFPSFIQGVAGFGTPIAVAAPLLLAMGLRPVLAVALPLVGYH
ncbi:lactate permease, partial [Enterococcus hirae]